MYGDYFDMILKVGEDPARYLGAKSVALLDAFSLGCNWAFTTWGVLFEYYIPREEFDAFVIRKFNVAERWPMNLGTQSYIRFLGSNEPAAFDLYIEIHRDFIEQHGKPEGPEPNRTPSPEPNGDGLISLLALMKERPAMYLGNAYSAEMLLALCNGFFEGELTIGVTKSLHGPLMTGFQEWMSARHPWALGRHWSRILAFRSLWSGKGSFEAFYVYWDLFLKRNPPDALTPAGQKLFDQASQDGLMTKEEQESYKRTLREIFWSS